MLTRDPKNTSTSDTQKKPSQGRETATTTAQVNNNASTETLEKETEPKYQRNKPRNVADRSNSHGSNEGNEDAPPNQTAKRNDHKQTKRRMPTRSSHNLNESVNDATQQTTSVNHAPIIIPATRTVSPPLAQRRRATSLARGNEIR